MKPSRRVFRLAASKATEVICAVCGRHVARQSRQQQFCSTRCRKRGNYAKSVELGRFFRVSYPGSPNGTNPPKKPNEISSLQRQKSGSSIPLNLIGGFRFDNPTIELDPETRRAIRSERIGPADAKRIVPDDDDGGFVWSNFKYAHLTHIDREVWDQLDIPDFLRREPPNQERDACHRRARR